MESGRESYLGIPASDRCRFLSRLGGGNCHRLHPLHSSLSSRFSAHLTLLVKATTSDSRWDGRVLTLQCGPGSVLLVPMPVAFAPDPNPAFYPLVTTSMNS